MPLPHCPPRPSLSNQRFPSMFGCWVPALEPPGGQRLSNYGSARGRAHWELEPYSDAPTWASGYGQTGIAIRSGVNGGLQTKTSPTANTCIRPTGFTLSAFVETQTWSGQFGRSFVGCTCGSQQYSLALGRFSGAADLSINTANHRVIAPTGTWASRLLHVIAGGTFRGPTCQFFLVVKDMISHEVVTYVGTASISTVTGITRAYMGNTSSTTLQENVNIYGFAAFEEPFGLQQSLRYIDDPWFYLRPNRARRVAKAAAAPAAADQDVIWYNQQ